MRKAVIPVLTVLLACQVQESREADLPPPEAPRAAPAPPPIPPPPAQTSDTTEAGLWAHLQSSHFRDWQTWPGKDRLYAGSEPHGTLLTTYLNNLAYDALANRAPSMPAGALIVTENFTADTVLTAITAMYKVSDYDTTAGDWFWARWDSAGVADVSGRAEACKACHSANADMDYIMNAR